MDQMPHETTRGPELIARLPTDEFPRRRRLTVKWNSRKDRSPKMGAVTANMSMSLDGYVR